MATPILDALSLLDYTAYSDALALLATRRASRVTLQTSINTAQTTYNTAVANAVNADQLYLAGSINETERDTRKSAVTTAAASLSELQGDAVVLDGMIAEQVQACRGAAEAAIRDRIAAAKDEYLAVVAEFTAARATFVQKLQAALAYSQTAAAKLSNDYFSGVSGSVQYHLGAIANMNDAKLKQQLEGYLKSDVLAHISAELARGPGWPHVETH